MQSVVKHRTRSEYEASLLGGATPRVVLLLVMLGCTDHDGSLRIVAPADAPPLTLRLRVDEGRCGDAFEDPRYDATYAEGGAPAIGDLDEGTWRFDVVAWDASCTECFAACRVETLSGDAEVELVLQATACAAELCTGPGDGGVDAATDDAGSLDGGVPEDAGSTDAGARDGSPDAAELDAGSLVGPFAAVALGDRHTCATTTEGDLYCWGDNGSDQVGPGASMVVRPQRVMLDYDEDVPLEGVEEIALGEAHTCASTAAEGRVYCWGANVPPQHRLGGGSAAPSEEAPTLVPDVRDVTSLRTGWWHTCALTESGAVICWGQNASGEVRVCDGACPDTDAPFPMTDADGAPLPAADVVAAGVGSSCIVAAGEVVCWGYNSQRALAIAAGNVADPTPILLADVELLASGGIDGLDTAAGLLSLTCAVAREGLHCWGLNERRQIVERVDDVVDSPTPITIEGAIDELDVGGQHICIRQGESLTCWGANDLNQVAPLEADTIPLTSAHTIPDLRVRTFATGPRHTCAIDVDGDLWCWGSNSHGQIGDGGSGEGATVAEPSRVTLGE